MASMANDQLAVVIADNSESRDKHEFLETLGKIHPNVHIHCHSKNIGEFSGNWEFFLPKRPWIIISSLAMTISARRPT